MTARLFQRPKNATQSGKAHTDEWMLEFLPTEKMKADPLMGWTGSGDTQKQVRLVFATQDEALGYAQRHGIPVRVLVTPPKRLKLQTYADNFR